MRASMRWKPWRACPISVRCNGWRPQVTHTLFEGWLHAALTRGAGAPRMPRSVLVGAAPVRDAGLVAAQRLLEGACLHQAVTRRACTACFSASPPPPAAPRHANARAPSPRPRRRGARCRIRHARRGEDVGASNRFATADALLFSRARQVHFAESWNELHHLLIMESLGGNERWARARRSATRRAARTSCAVH